MTSKTRTFRNALHLRQTFVSPVEAKRITLNRGAGDVLAFSLTVQTSIASTRSAPMTVYFLN